MKAFRTTLFRLQLIAPAGKNAESGGERRKRRAGRPPSEGARGFSREAGARPRTAATTLTVNPFTGEIIERETPVDTLPGRRMRMWTRFLHTGEALGGCFLVYTGFALSYRRFFGKSTEPPSLAV